MVAVELQRLEERQVGQRGEVLDPVVAEVDSRESCEVPQCREVGDVVACQ